MRNKSTEDSTIIIDYYDGAYGPTIRIDVQNFTQLQEIQNLLFSFGEGSKKELDLAQLEIIKVSGLHSLVLKYIPDSHTIEKKLVFVKNNLKRVDFLWIGDYEQWQRCAALIEAIIESNNSGHQYLTTEGIDDALIELVYKE